MPYSFRLDPGRRIAYVALRGATSGADLIAVTRALYSSPDWVRGMDVVWYFSRMGALDLSPEDLDGLLAADREFAPLARGGRDLFVVAKEEHYGLGRLFSRLASASPRDASVYRSLAEARAALGVGRVPGEP